MKREFSGIPGIPTGIPIGILDMGMTTEIRIGNKMNTYKSNLAVHRLRTRPVSLVLSCSVI